MTATPLDFVFIGLSITSSWGNGHATTYRALLRELRARGHRVSFFERDVPWYADTRDLPAPTYARTSLYRSLEQLHDEHAAEVRDADVVVIGSHVPDGVKIIEWALATANGLVAFYDIDTPVTARKLAAGDREYLAPEQVSRFGLYLSFTGGPFLDELGHRYDQPNTRPLYCSCDPALHRPDGDGGDDLERGDPRWDLGFLGTYCADRQDALDHFLVQPAQRLRDARFVVAGPLYPNDLAWPPNVERITHVAPPSHAAFYGAQRYTLNITRPEMRAAGFSPSVRLFEAAACGVPIITDEWPGIDRFFEPGREILVARTTVDSLRILREVPENERHRIARRARLRALVEHTAADRAAALERYVLEGLAGGASARRASEGKERDSRCGS